MLICSWCLFIELLKQGMVQAVELFKTHVGGYIEHAFKDNDHGKGDQWGHHSICRCHEQLWPHCRYGRSALKLHGQCCHNESDEDGEDRCKDLGAIADVLGAVDGQDPTGEQHQHNAEIVAPCHAHCKRHGHGEDKGRSGLVENRNDHGERRHHNDVLIGNHGFQPGGNPCQQSGQHRQCQQTSKLAGTLKAGRPQDDQI